MYRISVIFLLIEIKIFTIYIIKPSMKPIAISSILAAAVSAAPSLGSVQQLLGLKPAVVTSAGQSRQVNLLNVGKGIVGQTNNNIQISNDQNVDEIGLISQDDLNDNSLISTQGGSSSSVSGGSVFDGGLRINISGIRETNNGDQGNPDGININWIGSEGSGRSSGSAGSSATSSVSTSGSSSVSSSASGSGSGSGLRTGGIGATQILLSGGGGNGGDQAEMQLLLASMRNQNQAQQPSQQTQMFQANTVRVINQAVQSSNQPQIAFDSIFVRFPTVDQLDRLIISGDTTAILKTIQAIAVEDNVQCDKKIAYLLQLLGRLRTAVEKKSKLSVKLKLIVEASFREIAKLQIQLQNSRKSLNELGLEDLKNAQRRQMKELQDKYSSFNDVDGQLPVLQAQLFGVEKQIEILKKSTQTERSRVGNDQLKLVQMRSEIGRIQSRLTQLLDIEAAIRDRLGQSQQTQLSNTDKIKQIRQKIVITQLQLKKLREDYDQSSGLVKQLQVRVERIRTDLAIGQTKRDRYLKQILNLEDRINIEKKKNNSANINKLTQMITSLKDVLPSVTSAIDKHYYNCYGAGSAVKVQRNGDSTVYVLNAARVADYLKGLYGNSIRIPSINSDVAFNRVDIFGAGWAGKFGYPFSKAAFHNEDFSFAGSFSCMNSNSLSTGYGTILGIGSDYIEAQDQKGASKKFVLGSCSRLESTQLLPKIGQRIYWQGVVGSRGINLYSGSCLE